MKELELEHISKLGFGGYRISPRSEQHKEALRLAINSGVNLIDTSTNYTNGESETLIGQVISEFPDTPIFICSKAGYIQGHIIKEWEALRKLSTTAASLEKETVFIHDKLLHCIHPDFLAQQLELSLERLNRSKLDCFLLHNPEYYFSDKKNSSLNQEDFCERLKKAFTFLEEKVAEGKIRYYGLSSNHLPFPTSHPQSVNLNTVLKILNEISSSHHFKIVQFPFNFLETNAIEPHYDGQSLLDVIKSNKLISIVNRPLNALTPEGPMRLATYEYQQEELSQEDLSDLFSVCLHRMQKKLDRLSPGTNILSIPFLKQFQAIWAKLPTSDAVDQLFVSHFFPFLSELWRTEEMSEEDMKPFFLLYDAALSMSRKIMTIRGLEYRKELENKEIIPPNSKLPLSVLAINSYLQIGFDHVLSGMRTPYYVEQLKALL